MPGTDIRNVKPMVEQLDRVQRHVLMLYYAEELTPAEIGLVLEIPESTVITTLQELQARAQDALSVAPVMS